MEKPCAICRLGKRMVLRTSVYSYCRACHAWKERERQKRQPRSRADMSPDQLRKLQCRELTRKFQQLKLLPKGPCEVCGNVRAENHHPDYEKPLEYRRLCRQHHVEAERQEAEARWRADYAARNSL
jgi:hypothetical protein